MKPALLVVAGAVVTALAFPPYGPGVLVVAGLALFLWGLRSVATPAQGFWAGFAYGTLFVGTLMWWLTRLHPAALVLAPVQGVFFGAFGWWLSRHRRLAPAHWAVLAVGGWALVELLRYRVPYGGMEWGAAGYALSDLFITRSPAFLIGTSGLTILVVALAAIAALALDRAFDRRLRWPVAVVLTMFAAAALFPSPVSDADPLRVAIVQGSTPCPFEHCADERLGTFLNHLELTQGIEDGSVDLVVWSESSMGSSNADPVRNPEIGQAVTTETKRLGAWLLAGTDRPLNDTHWVNANVLFDPSGEVVGEYHKQLPIPFGEYVPFRSFFTRLISELDRVPRDMIPGDGPEVFEVDGVGLGSVISWEGGFSRFARAHVREGARVLVVATNNDSYGPGSPTSDIFIGMTRMRAAELGVPVIHAAVSGKSVLIDARGAFITEISGSGVRAVLQESVVPGGPSPYARVGDLVMYAAAVVGLAGWWRARRVVVSGDPAREEE